MTVTSKNPHESNAAARATCAHCGLPVPSSRCRISDDNQFCCSGCEAVWNVLHDTNLTEYYRLRDAYGETRPGAYESWTRFEIFDPGYRKP